MLQLPQQRYTGLIHLTEVSEDELQVIATTVILHNPYKHHTIKFMLYDSIVDYEQKGYRLDSKTF